jgi:outer membrane lipoprotein carrier protein
MPDDCEKESVASPVDSGILPVPPMRKFLLIAPIFLLGMSLRADDIPAAALAPIKRWIAQQGDIRTLSADFVQTRRLRVLRDPVARPGHLWFATPGGFRWQLGDPPEMIALRRKDAVYLISVKARKFTRQDPAAMAAKSGMRDMPMMEFPMATDYADFTRRFEVRSIKVDGNRCTANILPRDAGARKFLQKVEVVFDPETGDMQAFEVAFRDGSALRNEFSNVQVNRRIDPAIFSFDLTGYTETRGKN